ncbi:MAG TPA: hypothetical protein VGO74_11650 [Modestobacter sp.]|jgi:hypothetical protein|nr:hypothetical protein [Modestobacter sp.]
MTSPAPDWVDQARRFLAGSGLADALAGMGRADQPAGSVPGDDAGHAAECRSCPLCIGLAALRGRRPDLLEGLADLLGTAATVIRAAAAAPADAGPADAGPADPAPADPGPAEAPAEDDPEPAPASVQRIEVA